MTQSTNVAYINPQVLKWARTRSGLSHEELRLKLKIDPEDFAAWESGASRPPFDKAQKIARALQIPFGYLFLSNPPDLAIPLPDMRTPGNRPLGLEFLEVVYDALLKQDWYRDRLQEMKEPRLKFVGSFTLDNDVDQIAADIRRALGMGTSLRKSASDWADYISKISHRCEDIGILVMRSGVVGNSTRRKISSREFQGFAVTDPFVPVIFINSADFKAAQVFTLIHETAHIWIGQSAVSGFDPSLPAKDIDSVEEFCNQITAEALVPREEFAVVWRGSDIETLVSRLARHFWVSGLVILRRAFELDKITRAEFFEHLEIERKKIKRQKATGGNYYRNVIARMGSKFTKAVLTELHAGNLLYRDAAKLLRLKVPTLVKLSEQSK
jgi:Zn-dependent peptidase ImmA (M78 family)